MPSGIVDSLPSGARVVVASRLPSPVQIARMNAKSGVMAFAMGNVDMFLGSLVDIGLFPESEKDRMRPIVSELMEHLRGADPMGGGQLDFAALRMRVLETIDRMEGVAIVPSEPTPEPVPEPAPSPPSAMSTPQMSAPPAPSKTPWIILGLGALLALIGTGALVLALLMR